VVVASFFVTSSIAIVFIALKPSSIAESSCFIIALPLLQQQVATIFVE